jgi:hypothetical protein
MLYVQFWAPDDGRRNRLKYVGHFAEINELCNVASCWLYLKVHSRCAGPWTSNVIHVVQKTSFNKSSMKLKLVTYTLRILSSVQLFAHDTVFSKQLSVDMSRDRVQTNEHRQSIRPSHSIRLTNHADDISKSEFTSLSWIPVSGGSE